MQSAVAVQELETGFLHKDLVPTDLWERLVGRIVEDEGVGHEEAEQIIGATLGFLKLCADNHDQRFAPSPKVDIGWHAFLLYTKGYAEFCKLHAQGRFIHHEPNDRLGPALEGAGVRGTVQFMRENGVPFDPETWSITDSKCTVDCRDDCFRCSS